MRSYSVSRKIDAPPEKVWSLLTDGSGFGGWNPAVERVEGRIAPGETIRVFTTQNPGRPFTLRVTELVPNRRMVWSGGMPLNLFRGVRTFELAADGAGSTDFSMREDFTGLLLPLIWKAMPDLTEAFEATASGLKSRAESQ